MDIQFWNNLKVLREQKGYTQEQLAKSLNTTQRRISYFENGKVEPDLATLWQIADLFDVSIDYIIGRKDY